MSRKYTCSSYQQRPSVFYLFMALFGCLALYLTPGIAEAARTCTPGAIRKVVEWDIKPLGTNFENNDVVATMQASFTYTVGTGSGSSRVFLPPLLNGLGPHDTVLLPSNPGLGLRVKWMGATASRSFKSTQGVSAGTPITVLSQSGEHLIFFGEMEGNSGYTFTHQWLFELVVTSKQAYVGGTVTFRMSGDELEIATDVYPSSSGNNHGDTCTGGPLNVMAALRGTLGLPGGQLPNPQTPTCNFTENSLNQQVLLGTATTGRIAEYNAPRSAGQAGQARFGLVGAHCEFDTKFDIYFTDANNANSTASYLTLLSRANSAENVGIRLYHDTNDTPIAFGPAPTGSSIPARAPIRIGPLTSGNVNVEVPFYAQYTQTSQTSSSRPIRVGDVQASAIVTIVYP